MLKHIVMWQLKPIAHGNDKAVNAQWIKERLESLHGKIDGLLHLEVGLHIEPLPNAADLVLYSEFENQAALDFYQQHPAHLEILPFIKESVQTRQVVDYFI